MYLLWLFRLWYCSKCLAVMNCSAVALWYCSMNKSDSLFYCFILMIIVKKIQNPNIFFTFSKKYYWLHIYHIISADLPWFWLKNTKIPQLVPKNGIFWSTNFRKIPFLPLFLYIFCTKMTQMTQCHTYINTWRNFIKI